MKLSNSMIEQMARPPCTAPAPDCAGPCACGTLLVPFFRVERVARGALLPIDPAEGAGGKRGPVAY